MIVVIEKKEQNAIRYACALIDYRVAFYTVEANSNLLRADIMDQDGDEISNNMAYNIGRQVEIKLACEAFAKAK